MSKSPNVSVRNGVVEKQCGHCRAFKGIHFFSAANWRAANGRLCRTCHRESDRKNQRKRGVPRFPNAWREFSIPPKEVK